MKSQERYELLMKALSEGKSMSEAAREQNVTCALLSQVKKKHGQFTVKLHEGPTVATSETAEA